MKQPSWVTREAGDGSATSILVYSSLAATNTNWADHLSKSVFGDPANPNTAWNDSAVLALSISASANDASMRSSCPTSSGHIAWGKAKMNDTCFNGTTYPNTEKRHVMCQEVGHDFGLGHTSENGSSQNTCMDYYRNTSASDWTSTGPNQHDFDQLLTQHHYGALAPPPLSTLSAAAGAVGDDLNQPWQWGTPFSFDALGRAVAFRLELDEESSIVTFVRWADSNDEPQEGVTDIEGDR